MRPVCIKVYSEVRDHAVGAIGDLTLSWVYGINTTVDYGN